MFVLIFSFAISANLPENFSKYQSNFIFECDEPEKCFAAFDKYMSAPEVAGLEVDFYAINHNGWDTASHGISFYFKDADEYAASGLFYATSKAGKFLLKLKKDLILLLLMKQVIIIKNFKYYFVDISI